jgi:hypothetical protein
MAKKKKLINEHNNYLCKYHIFNVFIVSNKYSIIVIALFENRLIYCYLFGVSFVEGTPEFGVFFVSVELVVDVTGVESVD